jgi:hypothetical protein
VDKNRNAAYVVALDKINRGGDGKPCWPAALVQITRTFTKQRGNGRPMDMDNLLSICKPSIDGLVDAGVLADDQHVWFSPPVQRLSAAANRIRFDVVRLTGETTADFDPWPINRAIIQAITEGTSHVDTVMRESGEV